MDVYYTYNYLSAGWMALQALPLLASPTLIITLLSPDVRDTTPLEAYLSRSLGFTLLTVAGLTLLLTGSIPLTTSISAAATATGVGMDPDDPTAPYAVPTLSLTLAYHATVGFYCWTQHAKAVDGGGGMVYLLAAIISGVLAAIGGWCVLFASSSGRISRKTGADKRTSGFPFKNVEADKKRAKVKRED
ncbi:hypothetical protein BDZ91DRAFT_711644 [Kalaharituber pfeilii]|nr:hypothetical protein BDZ91DRAFT_711644 [Kalaharituber pfeilii]